MSQTLYQSMRLNIVELCLSLPNLCRSIFIIMTRATHMSRNLYDAYKSLSFLKILYRAIRVYLWYAFASNHYVVLIGIMNT